MRGPLALSTAGLLLAGLLLAGCGANPPEVDGLPPGVAGVPASELAQPVDQALHDRLPAPVRQRGTLISVNNGSFPPYEIAGSDGYSLRGASADLGVAVGNVLGVQIETVTIDGLASQLSGISTGRYDLALGPVGDYPERHGKADFVDWVREFVVFAVRKGNPKGITSIEASCGRRIAVMAAGSAEQVARRHSDRCVAQGAPAIEVQSYRDQPSAVLSVLAGRSDAFFSSQAPLAYFVQMAGKDLELAGVGEPNGFGDIYQGAVVPKNGPLRDVLLDALNILIRNGTYQRIMTAWGVRPNMLDRPGINLARTP